jgi:fibro-slime domain-containing protein
MTDENAPDRARPSRLVAAIATVAICLPSCGRTDLALDVIGPVDRGGANAGAGGAVSGGQGTAGQPGAGPSGSGGSSAGGSSPATGGSPAGTAGKTGSGGSATTGGAAGTAPAIGGASGIGGSTGGTGGSLAGAAGAGGSVAGAGGTGVSTECVSGQQEACFASCGEGTRTCLESGSWGACAGVAAAELCNGLDDDCNGQVDDALVEPCGGCQSVSVCVNGQWSGCQGAPDSFPLQGVVRDFHPSTFGGPYAHPDFDDAIGDDKAIVAELLGGDWLPVYAPGDFGATPTTHGRAWFDMWYRDAPGYNVSKLHAVPLTLVPGSSPARYVYDDPAFFPIDGQLFGNEGNAHNYGFTYELHARFLYNGGESFEFRGDDDVYVFLDGHLIINLGGVHGAEAQTIDLDQVASQLGLAKCTPYDLRLFFAERHQTVSSFRIESTLVLY